MPVAPAEADVDAEVTEDGIATGAGADIDADAAGTADAAAEASVDPLLGGVDAPVLTDAELLDIEFDRYKELLNNKVLDEADSVAKRIVELSIRTNGPRSNETANALTNLAIVQHRNQEYEVAQQNFESAIEIIEDNEDNLTKQLINPLRGLGAAQLEGGRPDLATGTFQRAVHISHVNEGPHNMEQLELLEALAETSLRMGAVDDARQIHDSIYSLNLRYFSTDQMRMVPSLMRRAAWQHRTGYFLDERATYRRIIRIVEDNAGKNDLALIEPLTKLGTSYFFVDLTDTQSYQHGTVASGEIYFKRARRIAEENPESGWELVARTNLALGDYYVQQGSYSRARRVYRDTWESLAEADGDTEVPPDKAEYMAKYMEQPVLLSRGPLPDYAGSVEDGQAPDDGNDLREGQVTVSFAVSEVGTVSGLRLESAQPAEFDEMTDAVIREVRRRYYRPAILDGEATRTEGQQFTHVFFYSQADLDALRDAAEAADAAAATESSDEDA